MPRSLSCAHCHSELLIGARFCIDCGAAAESHCPACNALSPVAAAHCPACGAPMGVDPETRSEGVTAERRQVTVMFCDLVASTEMSVRFDPEQTRDTILAYQRACEQVIGASGGFISRYLGDGILAFFGFPHAREDAAESAVRAGLAIVDQVARLQDPAGSPLSSRVGIATGLVVVGASIGHGTAREFPAVGETPNLAARLQALAKPNTVLIGESTRRLAGELFELRNLGRRPLKGFAEPVGVWAVTGAQPARNRFETVRTGRSRVLFGRTREAQVLTECQRAAWTGRGQAVMVVGEAGVGKSHLASWLADQVAAEPHITLQYQCSPYHQGSALYPFIEQLSHAAGITSTAPPSQRADKLEAYLSQFAKDTAAVAPLFAALLSIPFQDRYAPLAISSDQQRRLTLTTLLDQLKDLADRTAVLIVFEDLQWADPTSLELVDEAFGQLPQMRVLAIFTARSEFAQRWRNTSNVTTLELGRLGAVDARAMIAGLAAPRHLASEVVERIVDRSDGVPLYVEELTKSALEALRAKTSGHTSAFQAGERTAVPETLRDSLTERLDRLAAVKDVAQISAAIGRDFSYELLRSVCDREDTVLETALAKLEATGLLAVRKSSVERSYRFKHALVQEAAYETLLKTKRQVIHRRIAETLEHQFRTQADREPEVLAHHYTYARLPDRAVQWWKTAGEWAVSRSAYAEAASHFGRAISLAEGLPVGADRRLLQLRLYVAYGQVMIASRGYAAPESTAAFKTARQLAAGIEDAAERYSVYYGLWAGSHIRGDLAPMREMAEAFLQDAQGRATGPEIGIAQRIAGATYSFEGRFGAATQSLEQALACYEPQRDAALALRFGHDIGVAAQCYLALSLWPLGQIQRAQEVSDAAIEHASRSGHWPTVAYGHAYRCIFEILRDDALAARPNAEALVTLSREHGMHWWLASGTFFSGWIRWLSGERRDGTTAMRKGMQLCRELGLPSAPLLFEMLVADTEGETGHAEAALVRLDRAVARIHRTGEHWLESEVHRRCGETWRRLHPRDPEGAADAFRRAIEVARAQEARAFMLRSVLALARLRAASALDGQMREELCHACEGLDGPAGMPEARAARALLQQA